MQRGRAWKKRARRTATASLPLWARIPRFYIWNNELERAKDAICERPLNLYVCRRGALWLAYHRTQTQSATQWEFVFNPSTDIDSDYSYDTRTRQKCFIRTGYSFQPSIRLNSTTGSTNEDPASSSGTELRFNINTLSGSASGGTGRFSSSSSIQGSPSPTTPWIPWRACDFSPPMMSRTTSV